jgi:hypothetical protein
MTNRPRPLLAVRLIGPADVVTAQKTELTAHFVRTFGEGAVCRTSTRPASHANELRLYITIRAKEVPPR